MLAGCAGGAGPGFAAASLAHRERQLQDGTAGARDLRAEAELHALACRIAPDRCRSLRVYVVDLPRPQARAWSNGMLLVHGGLFEQLDDTAELAFVLAHELAHLVLGHFDAERRPDGVAALELAADRWAVERLSALGWRMDAAETLLRRLSATAPSAAARLAALRPAD